MTEPTDITIDDSLPHQLPCIACNKELRLGDPTGPNHWPMTSDGVIFHGAGNYGSAIYDPMDGCEYLRIIVCDDCLKKRAGRVQHVHYEKPRPPIGRTRCFSETLIEERRLGATQDALYKLADQAETG